MNMPRVRWLDKEKHEKNNKKLHIQRDTGQILLTRLIEGPKVEESKMTGTESKLFFYKDENWNSLTLQGPKEVLTLFPK